MKKSQRNYNQWKKDHQYRTLRYEIREVDGIPACCDYEEEAIDNDGGVKDECMMWEWNYSYYVGDVSWKKEHDPKDDDILKAFINIYSVKHDLKTLLGDLYLSDDCEILEIRRRDNNRPLIGFIPMY